VDEEPKMQCSCANSSSIVLWLFAFMPIIYGSKLFGVQGSTFCDRLIAMNRLNSEVVFLFIYRISLTQMLLFIEVKATFYHRLTNSELWP